MRALSKDIRFKDKSINSELLLFEAARADIVEKRVIPALKEGKVVIMDRFYDSTTAYQSFGRGIDRKTVDFLNLFAAKGLVPDITFYMRIAPNDAFSRKGGVEQNDALEAAGGDFHAVGEVFKVITQKFEEKWASKQGSKDIEHQQI